MYPWFPWELVADPLGCAEHALGTTGLYRLNYKLRNLYVDTSCMNAVI
jgi:hypothetical protein